MNRLASILISLLAMLAIVPAQAAITRVQSKTANTGASTAASLNLVFDSNPTAGNLLVLVVGTNGMQVTIDSSAGISWVQQTKIVSANNTYQNIFIGEVFSGASATVTINVPSVTSIAVAGAEYSGVSSAFDRSIGTTGTSTSPDSGAAGTTSSASQLWIGGITARLANGVTFSVPTGGFAIVGQTNTTLNTTADRSVCLLEKIVSSTGAPDAGATISGSSVWVAQVTTFAATASSGSSPTIRASRRGLSP